MRLSSYKASVAALTLAGAMLAACGNEVTTSLPQLAPAFGLTTASASLSLAEGDRIPVDVQITRTGGFTGPVTLAMAGLPAHVTVVGVSNPVVGGSTTFDVVADIGVLSGDYPLTLTATGNGVQTQAIPIALHVLTPSPFEVTVAFCTVATPSWVAFQDGNRAFTRIEPVVSGNSTIFRHLFTTNRGAVATLTSFANGALTSLNILYGRPQELAHAGDTNPFDCTGTEAKTLFGTVAGVAADEAGLVSSGRFLRALVRQTVPASFILTGLSGGPQDVLATRTTGPAGNAAVSGLILRRDVDLPDSTQLPALNFSSAEAFAPAIATVSIAGPGTDGAATQSTVLTSHSAMVLSIVEVGPSIRRYFALPESRLLPGDVQGLHVSADGPGRSSRSADAYFRSPVDRTVTLGGPVAAPVISAVAATPSPQVRARFAPQDEYNLLTSVSYQQGALPALVTVAMTPSYAAASADGFDLIVPDLSSVAGFDPAWALRPGVQLLWSAVRLGGTVGFGRNVAPTDGATRRDAFLQDTITVH